MPWFALGLPVLWGESQKHKSFAARKRAETIYTQN
jgi:hypothetical protein